MSKTQTMRRRTLDAAAAVPASIKKQAPRRRLPDAAVQTDEQLEQNPDMVLVTVPKAFKLTLDHHHEISYPQGTYRMPLDHAEHWYSKAYGVSIAN